MTQQELKDIRNKLKAEEKELAESLSKIAEKDKHHKNDYDAKFEDFGSEDEAHAQEVAEYSDNIALENNLEVQLLQVKNALAKIKVGTYGKCEKCAAIIPVERLKAMPTASRCLHCERR